MQLRPIDQQVVVVFGAASGIGRATAIAAGERGARVVAAARNHEALASLSDSIPTDRLTTGSADAADPDAVAAIADRAVARFGRIDTWAHVAGVGEFSRVQDMTPTEF